jgi:teichoic acid transport system ATP-binding protein
MSDRLNLVAEDVVITYRSYIDPQVDLRSRLKGGASARRRHVDVEAVRGVSFDLHAGESIGLIGHNGAGKSTILLGLAGLIELQGGRVLARSRPTLLGVASVLNMSLSGRRNIEIGCLAMGMTRDEVADRMDDLIEFSGLKEAIDLPLKAYSSGMRARLSFTVATVQEPEVLLVDEALAVGDADFRARATARLEEIRAAAGSVVVVSHNMSEIERMCDRGIWLHQGQVVREGLPNRLIKMYNATKANPLLLESATNMEATGIGPLRPMPIAHILEKRYVADQVEPWTMEARLAGPPIPTEVCDPVWLDLDDAFESQRQVLRQMAKNTTRREYSTVGAILSDWVVDHRTGSILTEWPSPIAQRQALMVGETSSPFFPRWHDHWEETESGEVRITEEPPRRDEGLELVYCGTRFPNSPSHWWIDVATRVHLALESPELGDVRLLVPPCDEAQLDALLALGVDRDRLYSRESGLERVRTLYYPGASQFGPRDAITIDPVLIRAARAARATVLPDGPRDSGKRLYISRGDSVHRQVRNEQEVIDVLSDSGFEIIRPDGIDFSDQVELFASADLVVGATGEALIGTIFSDPGTGVIELLPDTVTASMHRAISSLAGHHHAYVAGRAFGEGRDNAALALHDNMRVPIDGLLSAVEHMTSPNPSKPARLD